MVQNRNLQNKSTEFCNSYFEYELILNVQIPLQYFRQHRSVCLCCAVTNPLCYTMNHTWGLTPENTDWQRVLARQTILTYFNECLPFMDSHFPHLCCIVRFLFFVYNRKEAKTYPSACKIRVANLKPKSLECLNALNLMCIMFDHSTGALCKLLRHCCFLVAVGNYDLMKLRVDNVL